MIDIINEKNSTTGGDPPLSIASADRLCRLDIWTACPERSFVYLSANLLILVLLLLRSSKPAVEGSAIVGRTTSCRDTEPDINAEDVTVRRGQGGPIGSTMIRLVSVTPCWGREWKACAFLPGPAPSTSEDAVDSKRPGRPTTVRHPAESV